MKDNIGRLFPLILGPATWTWFFAPAYAIHAYICAGVGDVAVVAIILSLAATAVLLALWLLWRVPARVPGMEAAAQVRHLLSLISIIWTVTALFFNPGLHNF